MVLTRMAKAKRCCSTNDLGVRCKLSKRHKGCHLADLPIPQYCTELSLRWTYSDWPTGMRSVHSEEPFYAYWST